jgi:hypothetical protein
LRRAAALAGLGLELWEQSVTIHANSAYSR